MSSWAELEAAAPEIAAAGRRLIDRLGEGQALLATVRGDDPPRIHPVNVGVVDGRLYTFIIGRSPKRTDLEEDGRFALHAHVDPAAPSEFSARGRARLIGDAKVRATVADSWPFITDASHALFELSIEAAVLGERRSADDWPPRYRSWRSSPA